MRLMVFGAVLVLAAGCGETPTTGIAGDKVITELSQGEQVKLCEFFFDIADGASTCDGLKVSLPDKSVCATARIEFVGSCGHIDIFSFERCITDIVEGDPCGSQWPVECEGNFAAQICKVNFGPG